VLQYLSFVVAQTDAKAFTTEDTEEHRGFSVCAASLFLYALTMSVEETALQNFRADARRAFLSQKQTANNQLP
jgi:hypothetical protein